MGRISLLIGRFEELIMYSYKDYNYATPIILFFIVFFLGVWSFISKETQNNIKE